jgi:hypothetical protein
MKKLWIFCSILLIGLFVISFTAKSQSISVSDILGGDHALLKTNSTGILIPGAYNPEFEAVMVGFHWKTNEGSFVYSERPIDNVEFNVASDPKAAPSIKFVFKPRSMSSNIQHLMNFNVSKVIITLSQEDFDTYSKLLKETVKIPITPKDSQKIVPIDDSQPISKSGRK